jgi:AraC-like DNA-binding protein
MEPVSEYARRRPAPALRPYVGAYSGYRDAGVGPARHRGLPSPTLTMIITLDDPLVVAAHPDPRIPPGRYTTLVGGLHTVPAIITHDGYQSGIQVSLSPLGARALLGLPAGELAGTDLDAADVLGPFARELRERVRAAATWADRFDVLDRLLLPRMYDRDAPPPEVVRAWQQLLATDGDIPAAALADDVGWSGRYLSRRFAEEIGLAPKAAARVIRFDQARRRLQHAAGTGRDLNLAALAAACGYYDQAHLARAFVEFAGCPPSRWVREEFRNVQAAAQLALPDSVA